VDLAFPNLYGFKKTPMLAVIGVKIYFEAEYFQRDLENGFIFCVPLEGSKESGRTLP